ncbi:MAG: aldose 1-epimerase family protein [Oscillospiraceae bacterium]
MCFELKNGPMGASVRAYGGELVSLTDERGTKYIWSGDPAYWSGVNPLLFPAVGAVRDGVLFGGERCALPRHGFARRSVFSPVEQDTDFVTLELRDNGETRKVYPFPFVLRVTHRLLENGFATSVTVQNPGDAPLPFCLGAHTAFRCPLYDGERFEDYEIVFDGPETADTILCGEGGCLRHDGTEPWLRGESRFPLRYADFDRLDTLIFRGLKSIGVSLRHRETGRGVRVDFPGFPMLGIWSPPGKKAPFVCLEPWHGCAALDNESGVFEEKPHCVSLRPGGEKTFTYTVTVL